MWEQSFSFFRRSVVPADPRRQQKESVRKSKTKEKEAARAAKAATAAKEAKEKAKQEAFLQPVTSLAAETGLPIRPQSPRPRHISMPGHPDSQEPVLATKNAPRDSRQARSAAAASEAALFKDAAATLRGVLQADHVSIVDLNDYTLYVRRINELGLKKDKLSKDEIITDFLAGKSWPADFEPVVHYNPRPGHSGVNILGVDSVSNDFRCNWNRPDAAITVRNFLESWTKTRHFWWDREDQEDDLSVKLMQLMPDDAQTTLATGIMTADGRLRFATFVSWKTPPSAFADQNVTGLPFTWVIGGCTMAALSIRKIRGLEQSQISYGNLQAHELRTPLHQILAVTQLLRTAMNDLADAPQHISSGSLTTTEQIRDLLPLLDAIDTSGKTLHGIVDNILSFLDLKGRDSMVSPHTPSVLNSPTGATETLEGMFEELIHDACEEDTRMRQANSQPFSLVETVFEILNPTLAQEVTEDTGGALRRALGKILSNAYKFIEGDGCVEIYVDAVEEECPTGCEELALSRKVSIEIKDNGRGMDQAFVRDSLGEPWAKEDPYTTGSGESNLDPRPS